MEINKSGTVLSIVNGMTAHNQIPQTELANRDSVEGTNKNRTIMPCNVWEREPTMADCPGYNELNGSPREALKKLLGQTVRVTAVFKREGIKECKNGKVRIKKTVLITNIRDVESGDILAGHMWFNRGNTWEKLGLHGGDVVELTARLMEYRKGYWGRGALWRRLDPPRTGYCLTPPKEIRVVLRSHLGNGKKRRETVAVPVRTLAVA